MGACSSAAGPRQGRGVGEASGFKAPPVSTAPSAPAAVNVGVLEECQICLDETYDVDILPHSKATRPDRSKSGRNITSHRACRKCQKNMIERNQKCPWYPSFLPYAFPPFPLLLDLCLHRMFSNKPGRSVELLDKFY